MISWNVLRAAAEVGASPVAPRDVVADKRCVAQLGITRIAQASSVNVVQLVWSVKPKLYYLPLDEDHPREPDEPYGLSKLYALPLPFRMRPTADTGTRICETQADAIVRRFPHMRIASLRPSWSIPDRAFAQHQDAERRKNDLWGWVQGDACADAFLRAVTAPDGAWTGHEAFFVVAPDTTEDDAPEELYARFWSDVPIREGKDLSRGFFDCSKAERVLGWVHRAQAG